MSWFAFVLLACAAAVVVGAEWPRIGALIGSEARGRRERAKRKAGLRVISTETDEFAAAVERDLANLPTIEERDPRS